MKLEYLHTKAANDLKKQVAKKGIHAVLLRHHVAQTKKYSSLIGKILPDIRQECFSFGWSPVIRATRQYTGDYTTLSQIMRAIRIYNVAESIIADTLRYMQEQDEVTINFQADLENVIWKIKNEI